MQRTVENNGVHIAFETVGKGFPLVLLHGFSDTHVIFREVGFVDAFLKEGRQLIMPDARGHGESGKPHEAEVYTLTRRVGDIEAVLEALQIERADVFGYSMGGWTTLGLLREQPKRVRAAIVGGAHPYGQSLQVFRDALASGLETWLMVVEGMGGRLPAPVRQRILANDADALAACVAEDRPDFSMAITNSQVPLLLYAGTEDPVHDLSKRFAEQSGAEFGSIERSNHFTTMVALEKVIPVMLNFFSRVAARDSQV